MNWVEGLISARLVMEERTAVQPWSAWIVMECPGRLGRWLLIRERNLKESAEAETATSDLLRQLRPGLCLAEKR